MKNIALLFCLFSIFIADAKNEKSDGPKGIILGVGVGIGMLQLNTNHQVETKLSTTLPNIKVGYMLKSNLAAIFMLPGANYSYNKKARGFEGMVFGAQFWPAKKIWILGGAGLTFDAPAFYTVKDPKTAGFYTGLPALTFATGYIIEQNKKHSIDLQFRVFHGQSNLPNDGFRKGISSMCILGYNWL